MPDRLIILLGALALDVIFGEPPNALHPVVWMGRYIGWGERHAPRARPPGMFLYGAALTMLGIVLVAGAAVGINTFLEMLPRSFGSLTGVSSSLFGVNRPILPREFDLLSKTGTVGLGATFSAPAREVSLPAEHSASGASADFSILIRVLGLLVQAWLLKITFSARALAVAAHGVQRALERGDLPEARRLLSWHLVSRDTRALDEGLVAAAAVESVAENFSDSFIAPLLFFAFFGLPGAAAYRFANTADAMLGYRDARREYLGKFAARLDDVLNLIPARLSALLLLAGAALTGAAARGKSVVPLHASNPDTAYDPRSGWRVMWRDHARAPSPNAGWPMSAMAGALGVTLEKVGYYRLGDGGVPAAHAIARSLRVAAAAGVLYVLLLNAILLAAR